MKTATAALQTLLAADRSFVLADCYTITPVGFAAVYYTSADVDLALNGHTFVHNDVAIKRTKVTQEVGLTVASLDCTIYPKPTSLLAGVAWSTAAREGLLDGARVRLDRFISDSWTNLAPGTILWFSGRVAEIHPSRTQVGLTIKSDLELLNIQMPRTLYQPSCVHTLYDVGCTLSPAAFAVTATVTGGGTTTALTATALTQANGYFALGKLLFTSGALTGQGRTLTQSTSSGLLAWATPTATAPQVGDAFTVYPGCDKLQSTCTTKFNNTINFRGYPYLPVPETSQ